jgi:protoporphyrinogen oxidase
MSKTIVIMGGGISGLVAAGLLKRKAPKHRIILIEASPCLGGLLQSFNYGDGNVFDYGTHYLAESRIKDINVLMEDALPSSERHIMTGVNSDISGVYYNGKIQNNSPFPDLRDTKKYQSYLLSLFESNVLEGIEDLENNAVSLKADEYYTRRFGSLITNDIIAPIVKKVFNNNLSDMSYVGTRFIPLNRVVALNEAYMNDIVQTSLLSKIMAYPEQRNLPKNRQSDLFSFYPKLGGAHQIVDGLERVLRRDGVEIRLNSKIVDFDKSADSITSIYIQSSDAETREEIKVDAFINAAGPMSLLGLLKIDGNILKGMNKPATTAIVNYKFNKPLKTNGLYYFYCYDDGYKTFRVTDYAQYCPETKNETDVKVTLEMIFHGDIPSKEDILQLGIKELKEMNVLDADAVDNFKACEILPYGFPSLTTINMEAFSNIRKEISSIKLSNLFLCGALSEPNVYFQNDILNDTYNKVGAVVKILE